MVKGKDDQKRNLTFQIFSKGGSWPTMISCHSRYLFKGKDDLKLNFASLTLCWRESWPKKESRHLKQLAICQKLKFEGGVKNPNSFSLKWLFTIYKSLLENFIEHVVNT